MPPVYGIRFDRAAGLMRGTLYQTRPDPNEGSGTATSTASHHPGGWRSGMMPPTVTLFTGNRCGLSVTPVSASDQ